MPNLSQSPALPARPPARLALWMAASVMVFALAGSLALALAFQHSANREQRRGFEELARTNVRFLEHARLPRSDRLAAELGRIIDARVFFVGEGGTPATGAPGDRLPAAALLAECDGLAKELPDGTRMVGLLENNGARVIFLRPAAPHTPALDHIEPWLALGVFWVLSLALGWWLARSVTRPLQTLAASLPGVGTDSELPPLPVSRRDEIGSLARTLAETHGKLRDERHRRQAAERQAMLGRMSASLAHEVKNPLAAIRLHAQLLEHASPGDAARSRSLIGSEAVRIEELLGQWLSFAKPSPPDWKAVDFAHEIGRVIDVLTPQANHAKVILVGQMPAHPLLPATADRHRVRQLLHNLLLNAIQAQPNGGQVTVSLADDGRQVTIIVDDNGPGFSQAALASLEKPFFSEKEGGMGLGLVIVGEICEAHGGSLSVDTRPGGGARVIATFSRTAPDTLP